VHLLVDFYSNTRKGCVNFKMNVNYLADTKSYFRHGVIAGCVGLGFFVYRGSRKNTAALAAA